MLTNGTGGGQIAGLLVTTTVGRRRGHGAPHVILSERHDAGRIDRQLEGRTARRGEPGSTEAILSLEDTLLELVPRGPARWFAGPSKGFRRWCARRLFAVAQRRAERSHARDRKNLLAQDRRLEP